MFCDLQAIHKNVSPPRLILSSSAGDLAAGLTGGPPRSQRGSLAWTGSERTVCLSEMNIDEFKDITGIDVEKLLEGERHLISELIEMTEDPLDDLYEHVHAKLCEELLLNPYPSDVKKEGVRKHFVKATITAVYSWLLKNFNLNDKDLAMDDQITFNVDLGGPKKVRADVVVYSEKEKEKFKNSSSKAFKSKLYFTIIENKAANCGEGVKQLLVYLRVSAFTSLSASYPLIF